MAALTAAKLARAGAASIVVANRTVDHAERLAAQYDAARAMPARRGPAELDGPVDLLVSCTGATGTVVDVDDISLRAARPIARWPSSTWPCRATSTPVWPHCRASA